MTQSPSNIPSFLTNFPPIPRSEHRDVKNGNPSDPRRYTAFPKNRKHPHSVLVASYAQAAIGAQPKSFADVVKSTGVNPSHALEGIVPSPHRHSWDIPPSSCERRSASSSPPHRHSWDTSQTIGPSGKHAADLSPDVRAYNAQMTTWNYANQHEKAISVFKDMLARGIPPNCVTLTSAIKAHSMLHDLPSAVKVFEEANIPPDGPMINVMIQACCLEGDLDRAVSILEKMKTAPVKPETRTYNLLIKTCVEIDPGRAIPIFKTMVYENKVEPNNITYTSLFQACVKREKFTKAEKYFRDMLKRGIRPDLISFSSLLNAFCKARQLEKARGVIKAMRDAGYTPSIETFNTLVKGYCLVDLEGAESILEEMNRAKVPPNVITFNTLIHAWGVAQNLPRALEIFTKMKKAKVQPDEITFNSLINAYIEANKPSEALSILPQMKEAGIPPNVVSYSMLFKGFVEANELEEVFSLFSEMKKAGIAPDNVASNLIIHAAFLMGDTERAKQLFQELIKKKSVVHKEGKDLLDCHNCSYGCAIVQLHLYLEEKRNMVSFSLITGQGIHTKKHSPLEMKRTLMQYIRDKLPDLDVREDPSNPGIVEISFRK